MNLSILREIVENRGAWHAAVHGVAELDMTQQLNNNDILSQGMHPTLQDSGTHSLPLYVSTVRTLYPRTHCYPQRSAHFLPRGWPFNPQASVEAIPKGRTGLWEGTA